MDLKASDVFEVLRKKNCSGLFHANTVATSKTFLETGYLLSRQYIESNGLFQSPQKTDALDKKYAIYDHIFFDAVNISRLFDRPNSYGPVLFGFKLDLLTSGVVDTVRITRQNPYHWNDRYTESDKYYQTIDDFDRDYKTGNKLRDGRNHITFTTVNRVSLVGDNFKGIQIDNPDLLTQNSPVIELLKNYFAGDMQKLGNAPGEKIFVREDFSLRVAYKIMKISDSKELKKRFAPKSS